MNKKTFIIAEAGVNHNGCIDTAKRMVDAAADAGADAIKFQTFTASELVTKKAAKADYQKKTTKVDESQYKMIRNLELNEEQHRKLLNYANNKGIIFLSSPFDLRSIDLLNDLGLKTFKIPSGEITNPPFLKKIGGLGKKVILSTGMSNLTEIKTAVSFLVESGTNKEDITVLHCNSEYPTPMEDVNLNAMVSIRDALDIDIGYSDHTAGIEVSIAAVALGAKVIEKHFTLDRSLPGPDHKASVEPCELKEMVQMIRNVELALGSSMKIVSDSESKNMSIARKSIVASKNIEEGEIFSSENITVKRPGTGISPMMWDDVCGSVAKRSFEEDELVEL